MRIKDRGFTLIELLVIIVIIGVLTFATIIGTTTARARARDAEKKDDLESIKIALYEYNFDTGCFPAELPSCGEPLSKDNVNYLANTPCQIDGSSYVYETSGGDCPSWFKVMTNLEIETDTSIDKVGCRWGCGDLCDHNYGLSSTNISIDEGCVDYYVCSPSGNCEVFEDPGRSRCPVVFPMDATCNADACSNPANKCHDASGKSIPD